jgi:zinc protease
LLLLLCLPRAGGGQAPTEALPSDPALVNGKLENGFAYIIRRHQNPEGRIGIWLHVASGSLNETERTRGLAHYLEHMAFNGSANFPPGSLVPFFQSLGMAFGRDQNAFTSFDQTTYQLALPDTRPETLDKGLLYFSDVATRLNLDPPEIESERPIILEEKRSRAGPNQRVRDYIYERLAPESTFGRRLPIGTEEAIRSVGPEDFKEYYARWYVPSNMTLIVVGDCDPDLVVPLIRKHFAAGPRVAPPAGLDAGVRRQAETRAILATDPELKEAEISIARVEPPLPPALTVEDYRRNLVETIGSRAFNRRISARLAEGKVAFLSAGAYIRQEARAIRVTAVDASGKPEAWREMLVDLGIEIQRARLHGFSEREIEDVRRSLIASAEEDVQSEDTLPARRILRQINSAVARREPVMAAAQRLDLLKRLLPGITPQEVSRLFAANFDPTHVTFIAKLPAGSGPRDEGELVALGRSALNVQPGREIEVARAEFLMERPPSGGKFVQLGEHAASGVASGWLDNGVRVHYRFINQRKNEASVTITLAGGRIHESEKNRGITAAASLAWNRPATGKLTSVQIRDLMIGKKVTVGGSADQDTLTLSVSGDPADLETGLQLAYLLLTDPRIEPAVLEQWKEAEKQRIASRKVHPAGVLSEAVAATFYPSDEPRVRPLEADQVEKIALVESQEWLARIIREAPIEAVVVGDIDREKALGLVERYLGSLPARPRIGADTLAGLRKISRVSSPPAVERRISIQTPQAFVMEGFFGADIQKVRDTRLLAMAARILSTRMNVRLREEKGLVYSIGASSQPAREYPGFGLFIARAPTDPAKAAELAAAVQGMYDAFAREGPTEEEMGVAKKQIANLLDQSMKEPDFWVGWLSTLDYRGLSLDDVVAAPEEYQGFTAEEVRETFARYNAPAARFRFIITTLAPAGESGEPAAPGGTDPL